MWRRRTYLNKYEKRHGMRDSFRHELPQGYSDNKIVLMVRDPWTLYSYWEIRPDVEYSVKERIYQKHLTILRSILRVYDVTNSHETIPNTFFDFELKDWANSWYIHANGPEKEWIVEIGILCTAGDFFALARSNRVKTPPDTMSKIYDTKKRYIKEWLPSYDTRSGLFGSASLHFQHKERR